MKGREIGREIGQKKICVNRNYQERDTTKLVEKKELRKKERKERKKEERKKRKEGRKKERKKERKKAARPVKA